MSEEIITLTVVSVIHKVKQSDNTPFCEVTDVNGVKYTAWDTEIISKLTASVNKTVSLKVVTKGTYKNIRGYMGFADKGSQPEPMPVNEIITPRTRSPIVEKNSPVEVLEVPKQNSREYGKAGDRVKIYFDTAKDLAEQKAALTLAGLFPKSEKEE